MGVTLFSAFLHLDLPSQSPVRHLLPIGLIYIVKFMNMRAVCGNAVIHNDVLLLEISDCSENTDIPYIMKTFLKKCYEDKKLYILGVAVSSKEANGKLFCKTI